MYLFLFCSAAKPLYKRDALDSVCYPEGYLFRFRYDRKYVDENVWNSPETYEGKDGILVFLDNNPEESPGFWHTWFRTTPEGKRGSREFHFYPIRRIRTSRLFHRGRALYVDFRCGDFLNYGLENDEERRHRWEDYFLSLSNRPLLPGGPGDGKFILWVDGKTVDFESTESIEQEAWESVVARLDKTERLGGSAFFRILGLFRIAPAVRIGEHWIPLPVIGPLSEIPICLEDDTYNSFYCVPMGKSCVLKVLFSRPSYDETTPDAGRRRFRVNFDQAAFIGGSKEIVYSESKYNEERILLVSRRTFESFTSAVSIEEDGRGTMASMMDAPQPILLTRIRVPRLLIAFIVLLVVLSAYLLALDAESVKSLSTLASQYSPTLGQLVPSLAKPIGLGATALATFLLIRRLPIK